MARESAYGDPAIMYMARDDIERASSHLGAACGAALMQMPGPSKARLQTFQSMLIAAKHCPGAAYNLGNFLSEGNRPDRRLRLGAARKLFEKSVALAFERLRNHDEAFADAPSKEADLRDIASRCLTNIGGTLANHGDPETAVTYFRRAIRLYPDNDNAHLCLGNMGLFHSEETGISPLEGVDEWEIADTLGNDSHDRGHDNLVRVVRQIQADYGDEAATQWLSTRFIDSLNFKDIRAYRPAVMHPEDIFRLQITGWSANAIRAASVFLQTDVFLTADMPIEAKVTVVGSMIGTLLRTLGPADRIDFHPMDEALKAAERIEPFLAYLGDDEWEERRPPDTLWLLEPEKVGGLQTLIKRGCLDIMKQTPGISAKEAIMGILFFVDGVFRNGVTYMVRHGNLNPGEGIYYLPAIHVG